MKRRDLLALGSLLPLTRPARAQTERRFVFVPQAMPASLDPIATPSFATRTAAMAVFETLYGTDARLSPAPQMVQAHRMEDGGKHWTLQLRAGLLFHDGAPVTAHDCVVSLRRWMRRDPVGQALAGRLDAIEAAGDDTLTLKLSRPETEIPTMLTKSQLSPPVIMPARLAEISPDTPVAPPIGSGPFRLDPRSWRPGEAFDLLRFERYAPRTEESDFLAGRRVAAVDRVMWRAFDDPVQALRDGRADWVESLPPALPDDAMEPPAFEVARLDEIGSYAMLRFNIAHGPTANQRIRQAILAAIDQTAVMEAVFGASSGKFVAPVGLFSPASDLANDVGTEKIDAKQSRRSIVAMLKDAGYKGEPLVLLNPAGDLVHASMTGAVIEQLKWIGLSIQERKLDRPAFDTWRHEARNPEAGGDWSTFCDSVPAADHFDPLALPAAGVPDDPVARTLRETCIDTADLRTRRGIAARLQDRAFTTAFFVPLGIWFPTSAWRTTLTGQQKGAFPVFWSVGRAETNQ